ncbi:MAG: IS21-like element ISMbo1 family transposase [Acidimicrobiales bacterium]
MITLEDWALIRRLSAEGVPKAAIAERLGISRNTVAKAVASTSPPKYGRPPVETTSFTPFEVRVAALLAEFPDMPATVLAERVGWSGSSSWFRENVVRLRPEHRPQDPADRLAWAPGDAAQCDLWFPPKRIPLEDGSTALLPVLVIVAAHSRFMTGVMVPTRQTPDLLLGMWLLIEQFGRVPRRLIWDNETAIGRRGRLAAGVAEFCGTLATRIHQLKARDPESKGVVERRNGFFETSFMPGRSFASPADFNTQFAEWLEHANARHVRTLRTRPVDLVAADREAMLALPPVAPALGWSNQIRLGRDYYVRVDSNDYSVDPIAIGRQVVVTADLARVRVRLERRVVADHDRVWARHVTVIDPDHVATAHQMREAFGRPRVRPDDTSLVRDLADYDRAFGLGDGLEVA